VNNKRIHPKDCVMLVPFLNVFGSTQTPGAKSAAARRDGQSNLFDRLDAATTFAYISP
jgi:hypothetical protein